MNNHKEKTTKIYIGNLPSELTEDDLMKSINSEKVTLLKLCKNGIKTFCFLDCGSTENAEEFFRSMNGVEIMGRKMCVRLFTDSEKREESKQQSFHKSTNEEYSNNTGKKFRKPLLQTPTKNGQTKLIDDDDKPPPLRPITNMNRDRHSTNGPPPLRPIEGRSFTGDNIQHSSNNSCYMASCTSYSPDKYMSSEQSCHLNHNCHHSMPSSDHSVIHHSNGCSVQSSSSYPSPYLSQKNDTTCMQQNTICSACPSPRESEGACSFSHHKCYTNPDLINRTPNGSQMSPQVSASSMSFSNKNKEFSSPRNFNQATHQEFQHKRLSTPPVRSSEKESQGHQNKSYPNEHTYSNRSSLASSCYSPHQKGYDQNRSYANNFSAQDNISARMQKLNIRKQQNYFKLPPKTVSKGKHTERFVLSHNNDEEEVLENYNHTYDENTVVLSVANFPFGTTEDNIYSLFSDFHPLEIIMICNYPNDEGTVTEAFVRLPNADLATNAIIELDNTMYRRRLLIVSDISDDVLDEMQCLKTY